MGTILIRGSSSASSGGASSPTPGGVIPGAAQVGDLLIVVVALTSSAPVFTNVPAGWTQLAAAPSTSVSSTRAFRYRIASLVEAGASWSMTAGNSRWTSWSFVAYDNAGLPVTLEQTTAYFNTASAGTTSPPSPAITPAAADTLVVAAVGGGTAATTGSPIPSFDPTSGWTLIGQVSSSLATLRNSAMALYSKPNPGVATVPQTAHHINNGFALVPTTLAFALSNSNVSPTANAGPDQTVSPGATVTLTGLGSTDPDGTIAAYSWTKLSGPAVTLSSASAAQPTFTAPSTVSGTTLTFGLTVTDDRSATSSQDTVTITVGPSASMRVRVDDAWVSHPLKTRQNDAWV
ncbi:hypothetical protein I0C86_41355 [Plantactinospora sp. S1510]|uniref:PKD/Chitinase domain-containing protein n=1 Tax=Plantactinospora alkalitolerans TaxID=2789879 RepID=A0ABS0HAI4_9ACTN|nr:PKD domain-containing protein [Plantactinospora alkalitolerans]MBF9135301.1 hypothetical protein [Plantactinospora alkalitolerans]